MKPTFQVDETTNVAFLDVAEALDNAKIRMISVSEFLGLKSQLLARIDTENEVVLGLVIEDYKAFRREIRVKYLAWHVERITELLLCKIRTILNEQKESNLLAHVG